MTNLPEKNSRSRQRCSHIHNLSIVTAGFTNGEVDQEGPAHKKQRRTNVKFTALRSVSDILLKYASAAIKPVYNQLETCVEREAHDALKEQTL